MMKKILVAAVLVFTLCCCEQRKVAREMKAFMETEIRFTDDIFKVEDRECLPIWGCLQQAADGDVL